MKILIVNGPNLNIIGDREPDKYGAERLEDHLKSWREQFTGDEIEYFQSDHAGRIIEMIHAADKTFDGIVINAGGYTHTSLAIGDALAAVSIPVIEVHLTNIYARSKQRHHSYLAPHCRGVIAGFGLESYRLALEAIRK